MEDPRCKPELSQDIYRAVVDDLTEVITRFLPDGTFTFVNDVYCRVFGKSRDELIGQKWWPDTFPDDLPEIQERLATMSPENPVVVIENRVKLLSGEVRWMQFINRGNFDAQGRLIETQSVGRDVTERRKAEESMRECARRLLELDEELRRELATELHDEIGQDLAALGMDLAVLRKHRSEELDEHSGTILQEAQEKLTVVNRTVREMMGRLRPPLLKDFGLVNAVRWYAYREARRHGLDLQIELEELHRPSLEQELMLYRIFQEALHNVVKHARATQVAVLVKQLGNRLMLSVNDDGCGFDVGGAAQPQGEHKWGLTIMRERARAIGATLEITSAPGAGTRVRVEL